MPKKEITNYSMIMGIIISNYYTYLGIWHYYISKKTYPKWMEATLVNFTPNPIFLVIFFGMTRVFENVMGVFLQLYSDIFG